MRRVIKQFLRHPRFTAYLRGIYQESKAEGLGGSSPETDIPEASPISCRPSGVTGTRLNLLVPSLSVRHLFGGIATALNLFDVLVRQSGLSDFRIVLTDQHNFEPSDNPAFDAWQIRSLEQEDGPGRCIVPAGNRYGKTLAVGPGDCFIATAWWTAVSARAIHAWQAAVGQVARPAPYIYLIQDYEPGFYPWSSRYALAEAGYCHADRFVAVFNTTLLKDYFTLKGYRFPQAYVFEPVLHPELRRLRLLMCSRPKERRLLVYGRPGVARNAFELTVMGVRAWVARGMGDDWSFVSAGEPHPPIELGRGCTLHSLGKLSLEHYADELSRAAVGLSLMISPHPSYPPLEMAAFGACVVSNRYGPKELHELHPAVFSADPLTPESIADALDRAARAAFAHRLHEAAESPFWQQYLSGDNGFDNLATELLRHLPDGRP